MSSHGAWIAPLLLVCALDASGSSWIELAADCYAAQPEDAAAAAAGCPEASEALQADPWSALIAIPPGELSTWSLMELADIVEHYRRPLEGPRVDLATLDAALASLPPSAAVAPASLWEQLMSWLRGLVRDRDANASWLDDVTLSEGVVRWIWYASVGVIVLLALAVVVNEFRQHTRRRAHAPVVREADGSRASGAPAEAPAARSPGDELEALFRFVLGALQRAGVLRGRPSLTHREVAAAPGLTEGQRRSVGAISAAAERVAYGAWMPAPEDVRPYLDTGRRLLIELNGGRP